MIGPNDVGDVGLIDLNDRLFGLFQAAVGYLCLANQGRPRRVGKGVEKMPVFMHSNRMKIPR